METVRHNAGPTEYPVQGDIGKSCLVFGIAAADVRMIASKPNLLEPLNSESITIRVFDAEPFHALKLLPVLVDRAGSWIVRTGLDAVIREAK